MAQWQWFHFRSVRSTSGSVPTSCPFVFLWMFLFGDIWLFTWLRSSFFWTYFSCFCAFLRFSFSFWGGFSCLIQLTWRMEAVNDYKASHGKSFMRRRAANSTVESMILPSTCSQLFLRYPCVIVCLRQVPLQLLWVWRFTACPSLFIENVRVLGNGNMVSVSDHPMSFTVCQDYNAWSTPHWRLFPSGNRSDRSL